MVHLNPRWLVSALEAHDYDLEVVAAVVRCSVQSIFHTIQEHDEISSDVKERVQERYAAKPRSGEPEPPPETCRLPQWSIRNPQVIKVAPFVDRSFWQWVQEHAARNDIALSAIVNRALPDYRVTAMRG